METKKCTKCGKEKELSAFNKDSSRTDGLRYKCKKCKYESDKQYRIKNFEKISENKKIYYYETYREISLKKRQKYRKENKHKIKESNRKWVSNNSEKVKKNMSNYISRLSDNYISRTCFKMLINDIPKELIEVKRAQIQLLRACK